VVDPIPIKFRKRKVRECESLKKRSEEFKLQRDAGINERNEGS